MLLIRPLIEANAGRTRKMQTFIFFIFLVANVGGALTPLGDPPLFLGFLKGVGFFWTAEHLMLPWLLCSGVLLFIYFLIDSACFKKDVADGFKAPAETKAFAIEGGINVLLLAGIIGAVLYSGFSRSGIEFTFLNVHFALESIVRDLCFLALAGLSLMLTAKATREANHFTWDPILEVASSSSASSYASCRCSKCCVQVTTAPLPRSWRSSPMPTGLQQHVLLLAHGFALRVP